MAPGEAAEIWVKTHVTTTNSRGIPGNFREFQGLSGNLRELFDGSLFWLKAPSLSKFPGNLREFQ
jgi:hypothetical protein